MMEEIGKYQSIQDRIKRLSKGQNQTTALAINALEPTSTGKFQLPEDNRKQNTPQFTLSKKRQSNPSDYKSLMGSISPKVNTESGLQAMTFCLPELSRDEFKQPSLINRKSQSQLLMQKSMRMSQQIRKIPREIPYLTKRNQNIDDISVGIVNQKYSSKFTTDLYDVMGQSKDKSLTFTYQSETLTKRREPTLDTKRTYSNLTNLTNRLGSSQYETPLMDRYRDVGKREDTEFQKTATSTQENSVARMLKKCRSGTFDRVPGKIVRNK